MDYFEEANQIWKLFVPKSGQADTVQGELLRAVEKLRDEAQRNGNGNWDKGFEMLLSFLECKLLDKNVYSQENLRETKSILDRLKNYNNPYLKGDLYDKLSDKVVDYFKFYGSLPHEKNPNLYR